VGHHIAHEAGSAGDHDLRGARVPRCATFRVGHPVVLGTGPSGLFARQASPFRAGAVAGPAGTAWMRRRPADASWIRGCVSALLMRPRHPPHLRRTTALGAVPFHPAAELPGPLRHVAQATGTTVRRYAHPVVPDRLAPHPAEPATPPATRPAAAAAAVCALRRSLTPRSSTFCPREQEPTGPARATVVRTAEEEQRTRADRPAAGDGQHLPVGHRPYDAGTEASPQPTGGARRHGPLRVRLHGGRP
jgi:hypothetical protein